MVLSLTYLPHQVELICIILYMRTYNKKYAILVVVLETDKVNLKDGESVKIILCYLFLKELNFSLSFKMLALDSSGPKLNPSLLPKACLLFCVLEMIAACTLYGYFVKWDNIYKIFT